MTNSTNRDPVQLPSAVSTYLRRRGVDSKWRLADLPTGDFFGAVVIPSLAESSNLGLTLASLAANPQQELSRFIILVVVNNGPAASTQKEDNLRTLELLPQWRQQLGLNNLCWVDAASTGNELPEGDGVGLARKIGMDLALSYLHYSVAEPCLVCLDADTTVQPNYLEAIRAHFASSRSGGASINYRHQDTCDPAGQAAIERYELFLRAYVLGLELAGSPYAFHTVGSAMACKALAYVAAGGMNRRLAGEDFYFLQHLHKVSGVMPMKGTTVHPSPRASQRVPFGTGRVVGDMLVKGEEKLMFYRPELFDLLSAWLQAVMQNTGAESIALLRAAANIEPAMADYLRQAGFEKAWHNLRMNNRDMHRLRSAFHSWFDAFRTMRMMHHLTDHGWPRVTPEEAVPPLLAKAGAGDLKTIAGMLERLRLMQG